MSVADTIKADLLLDLQRDEGFRNRLYDDFNGQPLTKGSGIIGYPTIAFGNRADIPMPRVVAELWLEMAADERWDDLTKQLPWLTTQPQNVQRALANMVYSLGVSGLMGFTKMLSALQAGDRQAAASQALQSTWAQQVGNRANRVAALIRED